MIVVATDNEKQRPNPSSTSSSPSPVRGGEGERGKVVDEEEAHQDQKPKASPAFLGRHRMNAAISHLNTQINIIEKELNELEIVGESSIVCQELFSSLETIPDPLLPITKGPVDISWDRWFRGAHNSRGHKRWM